VEPVTTLNPVTGSWELNEFSDPSHSLTTPVMKP